MVCGTGGLFHGVSYVPSTARVFDTICSSPYKPIFHATGGESMLTVALRVHASCCFLYKKCNIEEIFVFGFIFRVFFVALN